MAVIAGQPLREGVREQAKSSSPKEKSQLRMIWQEALVLLIHIKRASATLAIRFTDYSYCGSRHIRLQISQCKFFKISRGKRISPVVAWPPTCGSTSALPPFARRSGGVPLSLERQNGWRNSTSSRRRNFTTTTTRRKQIHRLPPPRPGFHHSTRRFRLLEPPNVGIFANEPLGARSRLSNLSQSGGPVPPDRNPGGRHGRHSQENRRKRR